MVAAPNRHWWTCVCGKTLGEIVDTRVVIKIKDRTVIAPIDARIEQTCSCGRTVVLSCEQDKLTA